MTDQQRQKKKRHATIRRDIHYALKKLEDSQNGSQYHVVKQLQKEDNIKWALLNEKNHSC